MKFNQLKTPSFLIDSLILKRNASMMLAKASAMQVKFRPHVKTHKSVEIAQIQHGGIKGPIAVSTLAEARAFSKAGFRDITYAVPVVAAKLSEIADLTARDTRVNLLVDSLRTSIDIQDFARTNQLMLSVYLKVDSGYHRAGVDPCAAGSIEIAEFLDQAPNINFQGILTHAGHSYNAKSLEEIRNIARDEQRIMAQFSATLAKSDVACAELSVGSTPTCTNGEKWHEVTEIRPGNYIFFDKFQSDLGSCSIEDCAATILTRVIGKYPERNQIIVDAGSLALSKDVGAIHLNGDIVFGAVKDHPNLKIKSLSQEHGLINGSIDDVAVGDLLQIIPNHSCLAAAQFATYHVIEGSNVVDEWRPAKGW